MLVHVFDEVVGTDDGDSDSEKNFLSLNGRKKNSCTEKEINYIDFKDPTILAIMNKVEKIALTTQLM